MSELREYLCIEAKTIERKDVHCYRFTSATKSAPEACMEPVYLKSEADKVIAEKDAEIAELKRKLMPCLNGDCILTCEVVEKYGKENAELKQKLEENDKDIAYWREEYDKETKLTDALNAEIESLKASHYAEMVDAGMRERRLKRALYKACANWADVVAFDETEGIGYDNSVAERWRKMERKCLKKAEEWR